MKMTVMQMIHSLVCIPARTVSLGLHTRVRWGTTYLFAPQCPNLRTQGHVFVSGGGKHVEDNMAAQCGLPTEFYLTSAPCPDCAMMLYNKYKAKDYKPVIHIARPYQGKEKPGSKKANLHCLAMLIYGCWIHNSSMELDQLF